MHGGQAKDRLGAQAGRDCQSKGQAAGRSVHGRDRDARGGPHHEGHGQGPCRGVPAAGQGEGWTWVGGARLLPVDGCDHHHVGDLRGR
eukprot:1725538-Pyramimonas_sp.AAC.1